MGYGKFWKTGGPRKSKRAGSRPFGKTRAKRKRRVPKKLYKKRVRKANLGKFLDNKINTLQEKKIKNMIDRYAQPPDLNCVIRMSRGQYDRLDNNWIMLDSDEQEPAKVTLTDISGFSFEIAQIALKDIFVGATGPDDGAEEKQIMEDVRPDYGAGNVHARFDTAGRSRRTGARVRLRSFYVKLRMMVKESGTSTTLLEKMRVHYAIVKVSRDQWHFENPQAGGMGQPNFLLENEPTPDNLIPFKDWQFQSQLDIPVRADKLRGEFRCTVLAKGSTTLSHSDAQPDIKFATLSYKFPKPKVHEYVYTDPQEGGTIVEGEAAGNVPVHDKYFFVCRSDVPTHGNYINEKPHVWVTAYTNYFDG